MKGFPRWFRVLEVLCAAGVTVGVALVIVGGGWEQLAIVGVSLVFGSLAIKLGFVAARAAEGQDESRRRGHRIDE
ncbi:MAG: hypothetical protein F4X22_12205 [Gemmatimonadales bacterium]|nr:hypothetical protein [Candidatus Palauibacter denitrificans]